MAPGLHSETGLETLSLPPLKINIFCNFLLGSFQAHRKLERVLHWTSIYAQSRVRSFYQFVTFVFSVFLHNLKVRNFTMLPMQVSQHASLKDKRIIFHNLSSITFKVIKNNSMVSSNTHQHLPFLDVHAKSFLNSPGQWPACLGCCVGESSFLSLMMLLSFPSLPFSSKISMSSVRIFLKICFNSLIWDIIFILNAEFNDLLKICKSYATITIM